jgi:hypothetical protein
MTGARPVLEIGGSDRSAQRVDLSVPRSISPERASGLRPLHESRPPEQVSDPAESASVSNTYRSLPKPFGAEDGPTDARCGRPSGLPLGRLSSR